MYWSPNYKKILKRKKRNNNVSYSTVYIDIITAGYYFEHNIIEWCSAPRYIMRSTDHNKVIGLRRTTREERYGSGLRRGIIPTSITAAPPCLVPLLPHWTKLPWKFRISFEMCRRNTDHIENMLKCNLEEFRKQSTIWPIL